jgi:hypothetical protein
MNKISSSMLEEGKVNDMASLIYSPDGKAISKESYEIERLIIQHDKMEATYLEILPKVCTNLVRDLLRRKEEPGCRPMYSVEVFTKKGTDPEKCRDHILNTTGMVPSIYDKGTHYVTHMRLTLEILKILNEFDFVLEVTGDYIGTEASLGPMHEIGDAHIARTR